MLPDYHYRKLFLFLLFFFPMACIASNLSFLSSSAIGELNAKESDSLRAFVKHHLNTGTELDKVVWESQRGAEALIKVTVKYTRDKKECKRIKLALKPAQRTRYQISFIDLCLESGLWKIADSPINQLSDADKDVFQHNINEILASGSAGFPETIKLHDASWSVIVVPLDEASKSQNCRFLAVSILDTYGSKINGRYRFCLSSDDTWTQSAE